VQAECGADYSEADRGIVDETGMARRDLDRGCGPTARLAWLRPRW
jgi:hypothetical protein